MARTGTTDRPESALDLALADSELGRFVLNFGLGMVGTRRPVEERKETTLNIAH